MTHQKHGTGGKRSKLGVSSPARAHKSGYQLAPSRAPMADNEDLLPSESVAGQGIVSLLDASEGINLQSYESQEEGQWRSIKIEETSYILDERPPVEGRDSLSKDRVDNEANLKYLEQQNVNDDLHSASYVPPSRSNVATIRELSCARPKVEPLPLLENRSMVDVGSPVSHDMSPFTKTQLFVDEKMESPLSDVVADETDVDFEYDDYMPQLPGSYFTMDPQAYTLTWSKQPPLAQQTVISRTASDASADRSLATADQ